MLSALAKPTKEAVIWGAIIAVGGFIGLILVFDKIERWNTDRFLETLFDNDKQTDKPDDYEPEAW